jgi:predicted DNA-binding ribbon-helix-helix protein
MPAKAAHRGKRRRRALKRFANVRRPLKIAGWHTGVTLEDAFWDAMQEIAVAKGTTRSRLTTQIKQRRKPANLSSAIRLFVLAYYQSSGR